jgi:hypothetical protein
MAGNIQWFRWHHGSVTDPKFQLVARKAGVRLPDVLAVWAFVLETASASEQRGTFGLIDCEAVDCLFGLDDGATSAILAQMQDRGLLVEGTVNAWEKRQPKREREDDNSTGRSRAFREKQRHATPENDDATPCNAMQRQETPREEKSREEVIPPLSPKGEKKRRSRVPDAFEPNEASLQFARERKVDVQAEVPKFLNFHTAKGSLMQDWQAAFRTWVGNARPTSKPLTGEPKFGSDEYFEVHRHQRWWADAGFDSVWEAANHRCHHKNAHEFRDGKKLQVAA